ncbi:hypothetical protein KVR01_005105 [Diaporthe batatas]|uniref:uncharacterized protein n=1 Tax=Diaporthe batatas TaxID=748121 RepID=UPI001D04060A|nr:uncharacterized protein KVR01_005105 [Diaporthe batatas]KAG8164830.1 hypothetical protein KVR01_005105 [Diaporthe batatas]
MVSTRSMRLLILALLITVTFLYIGWDRPLVWGDVPDFVTDPAPGAGAGAVADGKANTPPPSGDALSRPGSPGLNDDETDGPGDGKEEDDYDYERPTSPEDVPPPASPSNEKVEGEASATPVKAGGQAPKPTVECPVSFESYMSSQPGPKSTGRRKFPLVRPPPECRTFVVPELDEYITKMESKIKDPDLYRLFQNSFPNTLDTMVKWHGYAQDNGTETTEELSYIITGDIDAMWLRDSASQLYSYLHFLSPESSSVGGKLNTLNSLWRGLINSHSRYIIISPYCHSFQPPPESGIPPTTNGAYHNNNPRPAYDPVKVFDCKWELDSLASFLQVSSGYYERTKDLAFFARYNWIDAVKASVDAAAAMTVGTYDDEGRVLPSAWTFTGWTNRGSETLTNDGLGNPSKTNGMVRTAFRPSDDATIFQFLVPANMMFATYLEEASIIMEALAEGGKGSNALPGMDADKTARAANVTAGMRSLAAGIRRGIDKDAVVKHRDFGDIFAYECDGFGGVNLMDDANVPSLLSMPLFGYARGPPARLAKLPEGEHAPPRRDYAAIYQNTRRFALSLANPYYAKGPEISAVGGPHLGPGRAWPMAALVAGMTAFDEETGLAGPKGKGGVEDEVAEQLGMVLNSTSGMGVVHESVNSWNGNAFTRAWFGWANGLMGELIIRIEEWEMKANKLSGAGLLGRSWQ